MEILIIWLALSGLAGYVASNKGRSGGAFFLLSLLLSPLIGLIAALVATDKTKDVSPTVETHLRCPDCAELVLKEARVCKHCGCKFKAERSITTSDIAKIKQPK